jgi:hypothetical protein
MNAVCDAPTPGTNQGIIMPPRGRRPKPALPPGGLIKFSLVISTDLDNQVREIGAKAGGMDRSTVIRRILYDKVGEYLGKPLVAPAEDTGECKLTLTPDLLKVLKAAAAVQGHSLDRACCEALELGLPAYIEAARERKETLARQLEALQE